MRVEGEGKEKGKEHVEVNRGRKESKAQERRTLVKGSEVQPDSRGC
jgi:hypothetical protein